MTAEEPSTSPTTRGSPVDDYVTETSPLDPINRVLLTPVYELSPRRAARTESATMNTCVDPAMENTRHDKKSYSQVVSKVICKRNISADSRPFHKGDLRNVKGSCGSHSLSERVPVHSGSHFIPTYTATAQRRQRSRTGSDIPTISSNTDQNTIRNGLIGSSIMAWLPVCSPFDRQLNDDQVYKEMARSCIRHYMRRAAIPGPMRMLMPQSARERIQEEACKRKTSMTRKVSQYFNIRCSVNQEVDLM